jgi:hypothetical protein
MPDESLIGINWRSAKSFAEVNHASAAQAWYHKPAMDRIINIWSDVI